MQKQLKSSHTFETSKRMSSRTTRLLCDLYETTKLLAYDHSVSGLRPTNQLEGHEVTIEFRSSSIH